MFVCHKMPYPPNDGGAIATLNMIKGFAHLGWRVQVITMQTPKHNYSINALPKKLTEKINWIDVFVNTRISSVRAFLNLLFSKKPYNAVRFHSQKFSEAIRRHLTNNEYNIVQLEGLYVSPYISDIRDYSKAKIALRAHNVEWEIWARLAEREPQAIKRFYLSVLARRIKKMELAALGWVDSLVPITERDAVQLPFSPLSKVHISPTGIEKSKFALQPVNHNFSLFHIGSLDWLPNQEGLLWFINNVWIPLKIEFPQWNFFIAGRNAPKSFESKLDRLPVKYLGEVPDAAQFIDAYDIMIVPLFSGSGMRIKIIEAMARSKCIVTTPIGKEGIPAKEGEEIFVANNAQEMKRLITLLMEKPEKLDDCSKKAFTFAQQKYSNPTMVEKLEQFYIMQEQ